MINKVFFVIGGITVAAATFLIVWNYKENEAAKKRRRRKKPLLRPYVRPERFHMSLVEFNFVYERVYGKLQQMRNIRADEDDEILDKDKLTMVLECLATGFYQRHVLEDYRSSHVPVGNIIYDVCQAIISELGSEFLPGFTNKKWLNTAKRFEEKFDFPHCLGAIDGRHVRIRCPPIAGSLLHNYKNFHSIVVIAVADADYRFILLNVGSFGSDRESGVFASSVIGKKIIADNLALPEDDTLTLPEDDTLALPEGDTPEAQRIPYFFVADDTLPLCKRIMKPYPTKKAVEENKEQPIADDEKLFNERIGRAQNCIENAFGVLCTKWLCLSKTNNCYPDDALKIVTACCILHNMLLKKRKHAYCPSYMLDSFDEDGNMKPGKWRRMKNHDGFVPLDHGGGLYNGTIGDAASIRDELRNYLNSTEGAVPSQQGVVAFE